MKVSVIVPFHDGLNYLQDCLDSLKAQEYTDMEVILVCDHLDINIEKELVAYKEGLSISVYHLQEKTGVAAARNLGLAKATGEYVYFLDSDDYLFENAIEQLVLAAEEENADFTYGKIKNVRVKRDVFLANIQAESSENMTEEELEEIESERNEEVTDEEEEKVILPEVEARRFGITLLEYEQLSENEIEERRLEWLKAARKKKVSSLLVGKKGVLSKISALHILYKKSLLADNNITFDESYKYYADITFLIRAIDAADMCLRVGQVMYVKRKHNDPINFPSLSQVKDNTRFDEYVRVYGNAITFVEADSLLRNYLDRLVIAYYTKRFAPNLRRSANDEWRTNRFVDMQNMILGMDPALLKRYKGYKGRLLKALKKGNLEKSIKVVNWHLGWKKLKSIVKSKKSFAKFLYIHKFLKMPMKENWVLCESFFGKSCTDSPKAIYEYLCKNYPGKYKFIWVLDNPKMNVPYNPIKIKRYSIRYAYYLARCKYYIFNMRQPEWVRKRKGNIILETWHGIPMKKLMFDQDEVTGPSARYKQQVYNQTRAWDYIVSPNPYCTEIFRRCFMYEKEILETGYPRNDMLHQPNIAEVGAKIKQTLQIPADKKVILYAPTFRDDDYYAVGAYKFNLALDLHLLKQKLGEEYVVLLRTHYIIADALDITGLEGFAYNVSKYREISELYLISDILITDYSSVSFDFSNLRRPMLFFTYDLEKYRDMLRGFYIDIEEELPGPLLFTTEQIVDAVQNIDKVTEQYQEKYDIFYEKYCGLEDGRSSERVAKAVFDLD